MGKGLWADLWIEEHMMNICKEILRQIEAIEHSQDQLVEAIDRILGVTSGWRLSSFPDDNGGYWNVEQHAKTIVKITYTRKEIPHART